MGKADGFAYMDDLIATIGEEGVLQMFCTRVAEGEDPRAIALSNGIPWFVLRGWMEDSSERMKKWELAKRCFADGLVYDGLRIVRDAGLEEVPLARMQDESYGKKAAKLSRVEWGEQKNVMVIEGMSMDAALGGFANELLEKMGVVSKERERRELVVIDAEFVIDRSEGEI